MKVLALMTAKKFDGLFHRKSKLTFCEPDDSVESTLILAQLSNGAIFESQMMLLCGVAKIDTAYVTTSAQDERPVSGAARKTIGDRVVGFDTYEFDENGIFPKLPRHVAVVGHCLRSDIRLLRRRPWRAGVEKAIQETLQFLLPGRIRPLQMPIK